MKVQLTEYDGYQSEFIVIIKDEKDERYLDVKNARYGVEYDRIIEDYIFVFDSMDLFLYDEETDKSYPYNPTEQELTLIKQAMEDYLDWNSKIEDLENWCNID